MLEMLIEFSHSSIFLVGIYIASRGKSSRWPPLIPYNTAFSRCFCTRCNMVSFAIGMVWVADCLIHSWARVIYSLSVCVVAHFALIQKAKWLLDLLACVGTQILWVYWSPHIYHHRAVKLTLRPIEFLEQINLTFQLNLCRYDGRTRRFSCYMLCYTMRALEVVQ